MIAADVAAFIERLGLAPAHVAGISDGSIVALHLGLTRPELVRTLVGVGVNCHNDARVTAAIVGFDAPVVEQDHPDWAAALAQRHDCGKAPGAWLELYHQIMANLAANPAYTEADLSRIPVPTLLLAGDNDDVGNPDQMVAMKRAIPHAEIMILNNAEHVIQYTRPHIVGPAVLDFLARHPAPAPA